MLSSPSFRSAFDIMFTKEFCQTLFKHHPEKVWRSWTRNKDFVALFHTLTPLNKILLCRWIYTNSVNIVRDHGLVRPEYDESRLQEIKSGFTKEVSDLLFGEKSDNVWGVWNGCNGDVLKFLTSLYSYDKYAIILYFD